MTMDFEEKIQVYEHFRGAFLLYACSMSALSDFSHTQAIVRTLPECNDEKIIISLLTESNKQLAYKTLTMNLINNFIVFPWEKYLKIRCGGNSAESERRFAEILRIVHEDEPGNSNGRLLRRFRNSIAHYKYSLSGNSHGSTLTFHDDAKGEDKIICEAPIENLNEYTMWFINSIVLPEILAIHSELIELGQINGSELQAQP